MPRDEQIRKPNFNLPFIAIGIFLASMFVCILKESHPFYGTWPAADASPVKAFMWLFYTVLVPSMFLTGGATFLICKYEQVKMQRLNCKRTEQMEEEEWFEHRRCERRQRL